MAQQLRIDTDAEMDGIGAANALHSARQISKKDIFRELSATLKAVVPRNTFKMFQVRLHKLGIRQVIKASSVLGRPASTNICKDFSYHVIMSSYP